jgi:hypothetical protein
MPDAPEWPPSQVPGMPSTIALEDEPSQPQPKARAKPRKVEDDYDDEAQPMELTGGSSGSNEPPARRQVFPYPFVNVTPYNGDVFDIATDDEEEPAAAVQRRARRAAPGFRQISQEAQNDARAALAALGPGYGRGMRNRGPPV